MTQLDSPGLGKTPQPSSEFHFSLAENPNGVKHFASFSV